MAGVQGHSRHPTLSSSLSVLILLSCLYQEWDPEGLGSGWEPGSGAPVVLVRAGAGGGEAPSFLYQLSSPAGDPRAVASRYPSPTFIEGNKDRKPQHLGACFKKKRQQNPFNT